MLWYTWFQLQAAGLIRYARGRISVLDRTGLERRSCECYGVVKKEYDRRGRSALATSGPALWLDAETA